MKSTDKEIVGRMKGDAETEYMGWIVYRVNGELQAHVTEPCGYIYPEYLVISEKDLHLYIDEVV